MIPGPTAATKIMKLLKTVLFLAIGARAFGPHGDTTTTYSDGEGVCASELNFEIYPGPETPELCWETCLEKYPDVLVAIDWEPEFLEPLGPPACYCQNACLCMTDVGGDATTITRDSKVDTLPDECDDADRRKLKSRKAHK